MQRACSDDTVQINFMETQDWKVVYSCSPIEYRTLKQGNRCHTEPFVPRLGSLMASSWKLAIAGLPRSLTVAEWKCRPYVFTGYDPDLVWFQPKSLGVTRMNSSDWYRIKQQSKWSLLVISFRPWLEKEKTGKAIYYCLVTNHSHPFPASCRSLGHECCLLSVNFRRENSVALHQQCFCHGFFFF